jgi:hypothetical protein
LATARQGIEGGRELREAIAVDERK